MLTNHPAHLYGENDIELPSALIPFCAYGTDMEVVGKISSHFSFPVCNAFKPTLHKGRVCYKLELDHTATTKEGISGGLTLMIDRNRERSVQILGSKKSKVKKARISLMELSEENSAELYLPTLAPHTFSQPGKYILSSLKKMTSTESFLKLPKEITNCQKRKFEDCDNAKLLEASKLECGCLPWSIKDVVKQEVKCQYIFQDHS